MNGVQCVAVFYRYDISSRMTLTENVDEDDRGLNTLTSLGQVTTSYHHTSTDNNLWSRTLKSIRIGHGEALSSFVVI